LISLAVAGIWNAAPSPAQAQQGPADTAGPGQAAPPAPDAGPVQQVTVTGFRSSLERSLNLKRSSIAARESIVAEDIGKFPEQNIADALVRLPGVEVVKDQASNEGQRIQLRGLGSDYTVTTFNGAPVRTTSAANIGSSTRDFNYDVFASELFSRADVYKAPLAELEEGGVAGVVDLQTPRPFDKRGRVIRYSGAMSQNSKNGVNNPRLHLLYSNTVGDWGFLAQVAHSKARNANAGFHSTGVYNSTLQRLLPNASNYTFDLADPRAKLDGITVDQLDNANLPRFFRIAHQDDIRERIGGSTSVQWRSGDWDVSLDTLYSKLDDDVKTNYLDFPTRDSVGARALVPINVRVDANNNLQGALGNITMNTNALDNVARTTFLYSGLNAKWRVSDQWKLTGQLTTSKSDAWRNDATLNASGLDANVRHTLTFDTGADVLYPSIKTDRDLMDRQNYTTFSYTGSYRTETDKQKTGRVVADFKTDWKDVEINAKFGASSVVSTKIAKSYVTGNLLNGASLPGGGLYGSATQPQKTAYGQSMLTPNELSSVASGSGTNYPSQWLTFNRDFIYGTLDALGKNRNAPLNLGSTFEAVETINTLFAQSDFETTLWDHSLRANAGVRYVRTDTDIDNYLLQSGGAYKPQKQQGSYRNALPSLSLQYDVTDDLVWRGSWGKTITRSPIVNIARPFDVPASQNFFVVKGNPELQPQKSTNLDTSLEWYFQKGAVLSASVFKKAIVGRPETTSEFVPFNTLGLPKELWTFDHQAQVTADPTTPIEVRTYRNTGKFDVKGLELAWQQQFRFLPAPFNNLGGIASLTRIKTAGATRAYNGKNYELPLVPETTYAVTMYYEDGPLSLRTSYNHKSAFVNNIQTLANNVGYQRWFNARGFLDASVGYKINDMLEVRLDGANLTNTRTFDYLRQFDDKYGDPQSRIDFGYQAGRTTTLSLRGKF